MGDDADLLLRFLQHERHYKIMKSDAVFNDISFWDYLDHDMQPVDQIRFNKATTMFKLGKTKNKSLTAATM